MTFLANGLEWSEDGQARSTLYGDVFFSRLNGLEETFHVFLNGNDLPARFAGLQGGSEFIIGELGFGSGLNMLATVRTWLAKAPHDAALRLFSFEKHLLPASDMARMLSPWPELMETARPLLAAIEDHEYGDLDLTLGTDRSVELHILAGDAAERISDMFLPADAWFLDGFSPARNPDLWSTELMAALADRTKPGGTFATYTAAGWVRRNLEAAGFTVAKRPGFGSKREMMAGRLGGNVSGQPKQAEASLRKT